nr:hypothetical protein [Tanacetum cinerariifolium]
DRHPGGHPSGRVARRCAGPDTGQPERADQKSGAAALPPDLRSEADPTGSYLRPGQGRKQDEAAGHGHSGGTAGNQHEPGGRSGRATGSGAVGRCREEDERVGCQGDSERRQGFGHSVPEQIQPRADPRQVPADRQAG